MLKIDKHLQDFCSVFKQNHHAEWTVSYVDIDAVLLPTGAAGLQTSNPVAAAAAALPAPALDVLRAEVGKAAAFAHAHADDMAERVRLLRADLAAMAEAERAAGLAEGALADERKLLKKRAWRL